ncbi:MAG TPA: type II secretion system F family protein [Methylibium sp.]|uniref:type II secretion system F family protein n=1 Tax=Methylibium sp. TaxID=2067992 RepID=UPI002DBF310C|nr:type II secretion system F family protein [Methylibium sp.]HEU4458262.1 type II secretion system F family protein [Methylibium sp.]
MDRDSMFVTALPLVLALVLGTAAALLAAWFGQRVAEVPPEDRTWRDRPPRAMRLVWWPIQWLAYYLGPALSIGKRQRVLGQLRLAGLDYALSPEQFIAARWVCAALAAVLFAILASSLRLGVPWTGLALSALFGHVYVGIWLRDQLNLRKRQTLKTLPFFLDMLTLCVEAGLNFTGGLQQAVAKGPAGALRDEFSRVLRDVRAGKPRAQALRQLADRMNEPAIHNLVSALIQAESTGMDLGPVLRAQAEQRRAERFARAEKLAMEAPVKMLFPLIAFIFPCTFIVLGFPIAMKFMALGM